MKNIKFFIWKFSFFLVVKFSVYLNRHVFVMYPAFIFIFFLFRLVLILQFYRHLEHTFQSIICSAPFTVIKEKVVMQISFVCRHIRDFIQLLTALAQNDDLYDYTEKGNLGVQRSSTCLNLILELRKWCKVNFVPVPKHRECVSRSCGNVRVNI